MIRVILTLFFLINKINGRNFVEKEQDLLGQNLKVLRQDFNEIIGNVEDFATDFLKQIEDTGKLMQNAYIEDDYNWQEEKTNKIIKTTEETPKSMPTPKTSTEHFLLLNRKNPFIKKQNDIKKRRKRATGPNINENMYNNNRQIINPRLESTIAPQNLESKPEPVVQQPDPICPKTNTEIVAEKQKLDQLKAEVQKLNELIVLLKDQQKVMKNLGPENNVEVNALESSFLFKTIKMLENERKNKQDLDKGINQEISRIKLDLQKTEDTLNKTQEMLIMEKDREEIFENELKRHNTDLKFLKVMMENLYDKTYSKPKQRIIKDNDYEDNNTDSVLGATQMNRNALEDFEEQLQDTLRNNERNTENFLRHLAEEQDNIRRRLYFQRNSGRFPEGFGNNQRRSAPGNLKKSQLTRDSDQADENQNTNMHRLLTMLSKQDPQANVPHQLQVPENRQTKPNATEFSRASSKSDDIDFKLKVIDMLNKEGKSDEDEKEKQLQEALAKLLKPEKKTEDEDKALISLVASLSKKQNSEDSLTKLLKKLSPQSKSDDFEVDNELRQLQKAINSLRPKEDNFDLGINNRPAKDDSQSFQAMLTQLVAQNNGNLPPSFAAPSPQLLNQYLSTAGSSSSSAQSQNGYGGLQSYRPPAFESTSSSSSSSIAPSVYDVLKNSYAGGYNNLAGAGGLVDGGYNNWYYPGNGGLQGANLYGKPINYGPVYGGGLGNHRGNIGYQASNTGYGPIYDTISGYPVNGGYGAGGGSGYGAGGGSGYGAGGGVGYGAGGVGYGAGGGVGYGVGGGYGAGGGAGYGAGGGVGYGAGSGPGYGAGYGAANGAGHGVGAGYGSSSATDYGPTFFQSTGAAGAGYQDNNYGPKSYQGPGLDQSYGNSQNFDQYKYGMINDLTQQVQNLEGVITNLNQGGGYYGGNNYNDKAAIAGLEQRIYELKGVINGLNKPGYPQQGPYEQNQASTQYRQNQPSQSPPAPAYAPPQPPASHATQKPNYPPQPNPPQQSYHHPPPPTVQTSSGSAASTAPAYQQPKHSTLEDRNMHFLHNLMFNEDKRKKRQLNEAPMAFRPDVTPNRQFGFGEDPLMKLAETFKKYFEENLGQSGLQQQRSSNELPQEHGREFVQERGSALEGLQQKLDSLKIQLGSHSPYSPDAYSSYTAPSYGALQNYLPAVESGFKKEFSLQSFEDKKIDFWSKIIESVMDKGFGNYYRKIDNVDTKKKIGALAGLLIILAVSRLHFIHILITIFVNAIIILYVNKRHCHQISLIFSFIYLIFFRTTIYFGIPYPPSHTNLVQMILTLKLVGLAFEKNSATDEKCYSSINLSEIFYYGLNYIGILTGPFYKYKTYYDHLHEPYHKYDNYKTATLNKFFPLVPIYSIIYLFSDYMWPMTYTQTQDFEQRSFLYKYWYIWPTFLTFRMRIYIGLTLSECVCIMGGLGVYPVLAKSRPGNGPTIFITDTNLSNLEYDYETVRNLNSYGTEFYPTLRDGMKNWNMTVQYWLATCIYKKFPSKKFRTFATMFVSGVWHGVYSGYFISVGMIPFGLIVEDIWANVLLKDDYFVPKKLGYLLMLFLKMQFFSYAALAFSLLDVYKIMHYYNLVYHWMVFFCLFMYFTGRYLVKLKRISTIEANRDNIVR